MLSCQKELFSLDEGVHYINCGYMSPLLKTVEQAGMEGLQRKRNPQHIRPADFFEDAIVVRQLFAQLIQAPAGRIALIPSVSYGMAAVLQNCRPRSGQEVITVHEEFPSDVFPLQRLCTETGAKLITVVPPSGSRTRGRQWNERILEAISPRTVLIVLSSVHWVEGTLFDLAAISKRAREAGALLVVDGTQSVGALPFHLEETPVDALICAGYKWLLGPYTSGFAYFGPYFDGGRPLEESWLNRVGSENFQELTDYPPAYKEAAARYNMGEYGNFIGLPMLRASLQQILEWSPKNIQLYCKELLAPLTTFLQQQGYELTEEEFRAAHLFGFRLPPQKSMPALQKRLGEKKVIVSARGSAIRVSPHVYNESRDVEALLSALQEP